MLRTVLVSVAAAGLILGMGYKVICAPNPVERSGPNDAAPWWLTPISMQQTEAATIPPSAAHIDLTPVPTDDEAENARRQLEAWYRMPILDAPIEVDPEMAFVPDPAVEYSMPIVVPEPGISVPSGPQGVPSRRFVTLRLTKPQAEIVTPVPEPEKK